MLLSYSSKQPAGTHVSAAAWRTIKHDSVIALAVKVCPAIRITPSIRQTRAMAGSS